MAFWRLFSDNGSPKDSHLVKVQSKKIESLEKTAETLRQAVSDLEKRLQETQMIVQYIAQANNALATDMATIFESLQSVVGQFEDPYAQWGLKSWTSADDDDDDDDEGNGGNGSNGGGWLN
jgi:DNA-binding MurR/RpiR family transcriptional regulator